MNTAARYVVLMSDWETIWLPLTQPIFNGIKQAGPDTEENGVALCSMHLKLFDRGVFTITEERELLVAEQAHGTNGFDE